MFNVTLQFHCAIYNSKLNDNALIDERSDILRV